MSRCRGNIGDCIPEIAAMEEAIVAVTGDAAA
jgi:hypothetical protein